VTTIVYELPAPSFVSLSIYDPAGRLIKRLVNTLQTAGVHRETWDGRDGLGHEAASGIYFYTLDAGELRESRKMILLR
jgi:flagellar hook assembly protein FlgD